MRGPPQQPRVRGQDGFVLIEVLVSALVIAIVAGVVLTLLSATSRSAADQRTHSDAYAVAQEDQARLRAMRISNLNRLQQTRTVKLDGRQFTVESSGVFVNNTSGTSSSCTAGSSSADYVRITSTVKWTAIGNRRPVTIQSIVSPSNGSLDPSHGTLLINTTTGAGTALSGIGISATGPGTFSGSTDSTGCANFADLPSGNYTMTTSASGYVNTQGELSPWSTAVGVIPSGTQSVSLRYDQPGTIPVRFKYRVGSTSTFATAFADSVFVFNAEMPKGGRAYGTPGGPRLEEVKATPLFPFKGADTVYAGSCESNNPNPKEENPSGAPAMAAVTVPAGSTASAPQLQLPALTLTVTKSGTALAGATVAISDEQCNDAGGNSVRRTYTTNASGIPANAGGVAEPALPWGIYKLCAQTGSGGSTVHKTVKEVKVQNLAAASTAAIDLGSNTKSGACP
jgi:prepilin-type N-terminal cleavage/methylation domain-containing protein